MKPIPDAFHVHAYTGLEALRLAADCLEDMAATAEQTMTDPYADMSNVACLCLALQEHCWATTLAVPERVLRDIRRHVNTFDGNPPCAERVLLALMLAARELREASAILWDMTATGEELPDAYDAAFGACRLAMTMVELIGSEVAGFDADDMLDTILAGDAALVA